VDRRRCRRNVARYPPKNTRPASLPAAAGVRRPRLALSDRVKSLVGAAIALCSVILLLVVFPISVRVRIPGTDYRPLGYALEAVLVAVNAGVAFWVRPAWTKVLGSLVAATCLLVLCMTVASNAQRDSARLQRMACLHNIKDLALGLQMYLEDNDASPPAGSWCDELLPYIMDRDRYRCPAAPALDCGYAYNATLSSATFGALSDASRSVAVFESDRGWNAAGGLELLTKQPRHLGGDHYGFADGHVEWASRQQVLGKQSRYRWTPE